MLWMETYLLYCSVRLGVVVVSVLSFITLLIPAIIFLVLGVSVFDRLVELFRNDDHYKRQYLIIKGLNWIENHSQNFMILLNVYLFVHMFTALVAIYGALRLKRWCLVPFSLFELLRFIYSLATHIVLMIMLKKVLNLGLLIAVTLAGGFVILYLGYNWATTVALFQVITLVRTKRYKALYGDDPLHPLMPVGDLQRYTGTSKPKTNQNGAYDDDATTVRVLTTPQSNDIDELKHKQTNVAAPQPIIAVLPYSRLQYNNMRNVNGKASNYNERNRVYHSHNNNNNYNSSNMNRNVNDNDSNDNSSNSNNSNSKYEQLQQQQIEITRWPARAWLQAQRLQAQRQQHQLSQQQQQQQQQQQRQQQNGRNEFNDSVNYNYWQWNEIFTGGAGGGDHAKHQLIMPSTQWP